jgi:archaellum component FlaC
MDFSRALQGIAEKNLKVLNMPTRGEVDEMLKDIHELKKNVRELKKSIEMIKNDRSRSATT